MGYVANPAGLGVSKRYGQHNLGGVGGVTGGSSGSFMLVAEVSAKELGASGEISFTPPDGTAVVDAVWVEREVAFGTGDTIDVKIAGSTILSAPLDVSATGILVGTLSAGTKTISSSQALTVDVALVDSGDLDGYVKVVVELKRI